MNMITKLRYAGVCTEDLIFLYRQYIRTTLEYCSVVFHSSLTAKQSASLERCQAVSPRIILQDNYVSYSAALEMTALSQLSDRRQTRCLDFSVKCTKNKQNSRFFPKNPNLNNSLETRGREEFKVNFRRTQQYKNSAIPYCQRLLNEHWQQLEDGEDSGGTRPGGGRRRGEEGEVRGRMGRREEK